MAQYVTTLMSLILGPARHYDIAALNKAIEMAKRNKDQAPIFYVLACRIGPFKIKKKIKAIGGPSWSIQMVSEWLRAKWTPSP